MKFSIFEKKIEKVTISLFMEFTYIKDNFMETIAILKALSAISCPILLDEVQTILGKELEKTGTNFSQYCFFSLGLTKLKSIVSFILLNMGSLGMMTSYNPG